MRLHAASTPNARSLQIPGVISVKRDGGGPREVEAAINWLITKTAGRQSRRQVTGAAAKVQTGSSPVYSGGYMRSGQSLKRWLIGAVLAAGAVGAVLAIAGVNTPARLPLVIVFL